MGQKKVYRDSSANREGIVKWL